MHHTLIQFKTLWGLAATVLFGLVWPARKLAYVGYYGMDTLLFFTYGDG